MALRMRLLRFVHALRVVMVVIAVVLRLLYGNASRLRMMLRRAVLRLRIAMRRLMSVRGVRPVFVMTMRGFDRATMRNFSTQMFASTENFGAVIAMRVELPMTPAIGADYPQIRIAADEHYIAIEHGGDVDVVRR
jgi:hypothetical protein